MEEEEEWLVGWRDRGNYARKPVGGASETDDGDGGVRVRIVSDTMCKRMDQFYERKGFRGIKLEFL